MKNKKSTKDKKRSDGGGASLLQPRSRGLRLGLTIVFLLIFIFRIPDAVLKPQLWAEDGSIFFRQNLCQAGGAIGRVYEGYFHLMPRLVALLAGFLPPIYIPASYCAAALILMGVVLYLLQSPRLPLLLAPIAVVLCPTGYETFGNLTNIQWFLSLGVLAIVLMQPSQSKAIAIFEVAFIAVASLTGPFALLLLPLFAVKLLWDWKNGPARDHMLALTAAAAIASCMQIYALLHNPVETGLQKMAPVSAADIPIFIGAAVCTHTLGTLLQTIDSWFFSGTGLGVQVVGYIGLLELGLILLVVIIGVKKTHLRFESVALLYFGSVVLAATLFKFRDSLPALIPPVNGTRYFLIPTIMAIWLLISAVRLPWVGVPAKVVLALLLLSTLAGFRRDPLHDLDWPSWAQKLEAGGRPTIPINPQGWFIVTDCKMPQPQP